ncbi:MAG: FAD-dependent oxidoreductase [Planctomycetia bacterium]|nr:FAD-dependent oxidoreductase [Planctomycetia bacterium]
MTQVNDTPLSPGKRRIVILGGGFGGVYTAKYLGHLLKHRTDIEVCLVNRDNYLVFQPMLAEVVSGNIGILDTVSPISRIAPRTRLYVRTVERVDLQAKQVVLAPGIGSCPTILKYDQLVIAWGNVTDFRDSPGLHAHALPFKNLTDALRLKDRVIRVLGEAALEPDADVRRSLLTFVVGGGGFSGVEVCAEMNEFIRETAKKNFGLDPAEIRVVLVHSHDRILNREMPESLALYAQNLMRKRGVEFLLNERIVSATPEFAELGDGTRLRTKTLISSVPASPHPLVATLNLPCEHGRITTDATMRVPGHDNVWSLGDCAAVPMAKGGGSCPPTAQFAVRQAKTCAENVVAAMGGRPLKNFVFTELGKLAALGGRRAVAQLFGKINLHGFLAYVFWRAVYWAKLPGLDRKIRVAGSWLLEMLLPPDVVQTGVDRPSGLLEQYYEPGEFVFRQGEFGDRCYVIASGKAEVLFHEPGTADLSVAMLGEGDCFGATELMQATAYPASVRCAEAMRLLVVQKKEFLPLCEAMPGLQERFSAVNAKLASVGKGPIQPVEVVAAPPNLKSEI